MKEMSGKDVPNARFLCPVIFKAKASNEGIFDNAVSSILLPPLEFRNLTNWCPLNLEYIRVYIYVIIHAFKTGIFISPSLANK